jgi:MFS family permease
MRLSRLPAPYDRLVVPVYVPSLLMAVSQDALLVLLPLYVLELGLGPAFAALAVGLRGLGVLLFDVPAGILVARFGEKPVLVLGLVSVCAGLVLLAAVPHVLAVVVAALLLGAGFAAWMLGRQSYIAATCETREIGRAIAVMAGVQRGGAFIGPALGGFIAYSAGFAAAFGFGALCAVAAGLAVHRYVAKIAPQESDASGLAGTARALREHKREFATAGVAALALQLMRGSRQVLIPLVGQAVGLDVATIGVIYSLSAAIDMSLFYPVGVLVDTRGRKWSVVPAMFLFALGFALLPAVDGPVALTVVAVLLGFANGCGTGIVMIMGADLSLGARDRSQFLGVWRVLGDAGMASAPLLTSAVIGAAGLAAASATVAAIGFIGVGLVLFFVAETLHVKRPDH